MHQSSFAAVAAVLAGSVALLALAAPAAAHTVWLERAAGAAAEYEVRFGGHAGRLLPFAPSKLRTVDALDAAGRALPVRRTDRADGVRLAIDGRPAMLAVHLDNGIHARTPDGRSVEKPMNEVPGSVRATRAPKYHKTIVEWAPVVARPVGQPFEVVPVAATVPRVGVPMRLRILLDGAPVAGVRVGDGEEPAPDAPASAADGVVEYTPVRGVNRVWAGRRTPVSGNPAYTELSYEYSLVFEAR